MQGALLIDKPAGPTSHDVVAFVRRTLGVDRAGHTGTLDPLATGLLILLVGSATRLAQFLAADEKEYVADVRLGEATATYDAQSRADSRPPTLDRRGASPGSWELDAGSLERVLSRFRGTFLQTPPPFSAKKIASVPAYEKARKQQVVTLEPVEVTVHELERLEPRVPNLEPGPSGVRPPISDVPARDATLVRLRVAASAGFYVRSLAHDIGQALGCGAHLEALRRTRVGRFRVDAALTLDEVEARARETLIAPSALLGELPASTLTERGAARVAHGNPVDSRGIRDGSDPEPWGAPSGPAGRRVRLLDGAGALLAVAERRPDGLLHPLVVLR